MPNFMTGKFSAGGFKIRTRGFKITIGGVQDQAQKFKIRSVT
jgi:hypothetical protein